MSTVGKRFLFLASNPTILHNFTLFGVNEPLFQEQLQKVIDSGWSVS